MAARSKAWVCGLSLAGIAASNPTGDMDVSCECCVLSGKGLCIGLINLPEESYWVWCVWVWSWNLDSDETLTHQGLLRHRRKRRLQCLCCLIVLPSAVTSYSAMKPEFEPSVTMKITVVRNEMPFISMVGKYRCHGGIETSTFRVYHYLRRKMYDTEQTNYKGLTWFIVTVNIITNWIDYWTNYTKETTFLYIIAHCIYI
jgi:hypothetical protein